MIEKVNTISRRQRLSLVQTQYDKILEFISTNNTEKLSEYILDPQNKIWEIKFAENFTILHNSCATDKTDIVITIIEKTKIRLGLDNNENNNLSQEEKTENLKIFKDFINAKTDGDNQTALHLASFRGNIKIIKLLIANYAEINVLTAKGYNMIHKAAMGNKPSAIIYFNKKYNMNLEDTDENQMNALHLATRNCMENSVIYLLNLGININLKDKEGNTALHYAVRKGQIRIIKKLIQRGADVNIPDFKKKKTPVMLAKNNPIVYVGISCLVFILYISLSFSNPGRMINKEYKDILDIVESGQEAEEFCPLCLVKNKFRSKHCLICQICVDEFDHHCFWVGNCIGKDNYTLFFIFLIYILINTLFNIGVNIYYLINEMGSAEAETENTSFPGFYFGNDFFIYKRIVRIIVSICIFIICILFFIPLVNLFRMQLSTAIEKRQIRLDEEEYEKNQLKEKLDNEVWEDLEFDDESQAQSLDMNNQLYEIDPNSNNV